MFKSIAFSLLFSAFAIQLFAQVPFEAIRKEYEDRIGSQYEDRLYVHTDKNNYLSGETIWFKVYRFGAGARKNSSKVAYIEILDLNNSPVLQTKIGLEEGSGTGSLVIPSSLTTSSYTFRAYTGWMKNFSPDFYFHKRISVISAKVTSTQPLEKNIGKYEIAFFPEGGNLVDGLKSKIAFKVTNQFGKGVDFKGALLNENNDTIARFVPHKFGIGSFVFTPKKSEMYKAVIFAEGRKLAATFPKVYDQGFVMTTTSDAGQTKISIATNTTTNDSIFLFAHSQKKVNIGQAKKLLSGRADFVFPTNDLGEGITHFTVFDKSHTPVCERLYFKKPSQIRLDASYNRNLSAREQVTIAVDASDETGKALETNLSLSVYRIPNSDTPVDENASITAYRWLSSELPGKIENAGYYLSSNDFQAADNLMLTNGWRRFKWEDVLSGKRASFRYLPEFEGHIITGKTYQSTSNMPLSILNYLSIPGKRIQFYASRSSADGNVSFFTKDFYGQNELVVQPDFHEDSLAKVDISSPFSTEFSSLPYPNTITLLSASELQLASVATQSENIYREKNISYSAPKIDSLPFYRRASGTYLLDDYTRFPTMEEVFREYVPEIGVGIQKRKFFLEMFNLESKTRLNGSPLLLVDGVPILENADPIMKYDPLKIQRMEVLTKRYYYGPSIFNGIASFSTYKGDLDGLQLDPRATIIDYEGLQLQREFYSPRYDLLEAKESRIPDLRSTLLWSPNITTNKEGKANISFFTGDLSGKYLIVLEGMNTAGKTGSFLGSFEVKGAIF